MALMPEAIHAQYISNICLIQQGNTLEIHFDLDAPQQELYTITPTIILRSGESIEPISMSGTNKDLSAGKSRIISWNVLNDLPVLQGEITAILYIRASGESKIDVNGAKRISGGPSNAFLSMVLPGLGDFFVNDPGERVKIKPTWIMAGYLSSVALALYAYDQSKENYDEYLKAAQQHEMNEYYDNAVEYRDNANFFAFVAGAIWLTDIVHVALKGAKNFKGRSSTKNSRFQLSGNIIQDKPMLALTYKF